MIDTSEKATWLQEVSQEIVCYIQDKTSYEVLSKI